MASDAEKRFLDSPRKRRALAWGGLTALVVLTAVAAFVAFGNTGDAVETFSDDPADLYKTRTQVDVDPEARKVAGRFILTAVARKNLGEAYALVHPDLLQGMTKKQWMTGNIPVVTYPADNLEFASFDVDRSYKDEVVLEVVLVPKKQEGVDPASFFIGLKRLGGDGPWRVFYWAPNYKPAVPDMG